MGTRTLFARCGPDDTMPDPVFDTIGAVAVTTWGTAHLAGVPDRIVDQLEGRSDSGSGSD